MQRQAIQFKGTSALASPKIRAKKAGGLSSGMHHHFSDDDEEEDDGNDAIADALNILPVPAINQDVAGNGSGQHGEPLKPAFLEVKGPDGEDLA